MSNEIKYVNEAGVRRIITDTRDHIADVSEAAYTGHKVILNFPDANTYFHNDDDLAPKGLILNSSTSQTANFTLPFQVPDNYTLTASWYIKGTDTLTVNWSIKGLPTNIIYNGNSYTLSDRNPSFTTSFNMNLDIIQKINETKTYKLASKSGSLYSVKATNSTLGTIDVVLAGALLVNLSITFTNQSIVIDSLDTSMSYIDKMGVAGTIGQSVGPYHPSYASINTYRVGDTTTLSKVGPIIIEAVKITDATGFTYFDEGH